MRVVSSALGVLYVFFLLVVVFTVALSLHYLLVEVLFAYLHASGVPCCE